MVKKKILAIRENEQVNNKPTQEPGADSRSGFPLVRTALLFGLLVLGFHIIQWVMIPDRHLTLFKEFTASTVAGTISLTGIPCAINGTQITLPNAAWEMVLECTALTAMIVFISFVIAFPSTLRSKAIAVVIGLPFLFAANIIRLVTLAWFTKLMPRIADFFHDYLWNVVFLFLVILMWIAWLSLVVKRERHPQVPC